MTLRPALASLLTAGLLAMPAFAADGDTLSLEEAWRADPAQIFLAEEVDIDDLQWIARPVIVFANSPRDPSFIEQMEEIADDTGPLVDRDVIVIIDTDRDSDSQLRERLRPRGFQLVLMGKDGEVELRKPLPWTVRELSRSIDKMPIRQREIQDRRTGG